MRAAAPRPIWWTRERALAALRRFSRARGTAPTSSEAWRAATAATVRGTHGPANPYPSARTILGHFASFRQAWAAAGVLTNRDFEPWSDDDEWYLREAIGVLPRAQIAADLRRSDAATKRRLYDLGLRISEAKGWPLYRVERAAQVPSHRLRTALDNGSVPYFRGPKFVSVDPGDLVGSIRAIDWQTCHPDLRAAALRSWRARLVGQLAARGAGLPLEAWREAWAAGRPYRVQCLRPTDRRWGPRLALPGPKRWGCLAGDLVRVIRQVPQRVGAYGRVGVVRLVYWTWNRNHQAGSDRPLAPARSVDPCWMVRVEFPVVKARRDGSGVAAPRVTYTLPLDCLLWVGHVGAGVSTEAAG